MIPALTIIARNSPPVPRWAAFAFGTKIAIKAKKPNAASVSFQTLKCSFSSFFMGFPFRPVLFGEGCFCFLDLQIDFEALPVRVRDIRRPMDLKRFGK